MPCKVCESLICSDTGDTKLLLDFKSVALLSSTASGCPYCLLLRDSILCYVRNECLIERDAMVAVGTRVLGRGNRTDIKATREASETYDINIELYVLKGIGANYPHWLFSDVGRCKRARLTTDR